MSVKLMAQVWEKELNHSEQSVLLAMADYADDDGRNCYPSYDRLAWKTGYSKRQVNRIIQGLCANGILVILKPANQHQSTHYWIRLAKAKSKPSFRVDISDNDTSVDMVSTLNDVDDNSIDNLSMLNDSRVDISDTQEIQGGQMEHSGWTNETSSVDMVSTDPSVNHHIEPTEEEEKAHARDPLSVAWRQVYADEEMPAHLVKPFEKLVKETSVAACIHGIKAGAANPDARNFSYIAECARNYVPPPPKENSDYTQNSNGAYHVDLPGVHALTPQPGASPPPLPAPMSTDDPWAIALAELSKTLTGVAASWLVDSTLQANGELAGVPLYRVNVVNRAANVVWLKQHAEPAIRKKLASILHKRILVDFAVVDTAPAQAGG